MNISKASFFSLLVTALTGAALHCLSLLAAYNGNFLFGILLHLIFPIAALRIANQQKSNPLTHKLWILLSVSSFFLGLIGIIGWFFTFILSSLVFESKSALVEYKDYINLKYTRQEIVRDLALEPHHREQTTYLAPYFEILQGKDVALKLSVIDKLSLMPNAAYINMLRSVLSDINDEVRLSAATNLRKIEDNLNRKIMELGRQSQRHPADDQIWAELGLACDEYAFSGILDKTTTEHYRKQAAAAFKKAIKINPFAEEYYKNLGRVLMREGKADEAINILQEGLKINPKSQAIFLWLMEYHFKRNNFEAVRKMAGEISPKQMKNEQLRQIIEWWRNEQ